MSRPKQNPIKATWSELSMEDVRRGVRRCGFGTDEVMLVLNELKPGMEVRPHSHDFDQLALMLRGDATFTLDGERLAMSAGDVLLIPAGVEHCADPVGDEPALNLDVFAPARDDYMHLIDWMRS
jgi:quercetin dioxygenase-like cupin family protein